MQANDGIIITLLCVFFLTTGLIVSAINEEFRGSSDSQNVEGIQDDINEELNKNSVTDIFKVVLTVVSMSFWTFGSLPFLVEIIFFLPVRILFWYTVAKNLRGVGG